VVELMLWTWTHLPYQGEVDLTQGIREHTIELERAAGFELTMLDEEGTTVLFPEDWSADVQHLNGDGEVRLSSGGEESIKRMVSAPGTYTVTLPKIPGFVDPGRRTLEIAPGEFLKEQVVLQRE
ncbi:MAG: hypothetical protein AAGG01_19295, partial [Planctomycetota bacterium]